MRRILAIIAIVLGSAGFSGVANADTVVTHETGTVIAPCWDHVHPSVNVAGSYNLLVVVGDGASGNWVIGTWRFTTASGHRKSFIVLYQITDQGHEWIGQSVFANDVIGSNWDLITGTAYFSGGGYFTGNSKGILVDLCPVLGYDG